MSVATQHSPFAVGSKRLYESEENEDRLQRLDSSANAHKRFRQRGSPSSRCGSDGVHSYAFGNATIAALRALFPEMSDKVGASLCINLLLPINLFLSHRRAVSACLLLLSPGWLPHPPDAGHPAPLRR